MLNIPTTEDMVVQAVQWTGSNTAQMHHLAGTHPDSPYISAFDSTASEIFTRGEWVKVPVGYWIVKQPDGTFKIKSASQFKAHYSPQD